MKFVRSCAGVTYVKNWRRIDTVTIKNTVILSSGRVEKRIGTII